MTKQLWMRVSNLLQADYPFQAAQWQSKGTDFSIAFRSIGDAKTEWWDIKARLNDFLEKIAKILFFLVMTGMTPTFTPVEVCSRFSLEVSVAAEKPPPHW